MRKTTTPAPSVQTVQGKQSNHGDFHLPVSVRHLGGDIPLYRAVAWWGLNLGRAFSREDVSLAFHIDLRRASGILNYLCHRDNSNDITLEAHRLPTGGHGLLMVRIISVTESAPRPSPVPPVRTASRDKHDQARQLARWLLSRPGASDTARLEAWKAACPVGDDAC